MHLVEYHGVEKVEAKRGCKEDSGVSWSNNEADWQHERRDEVQERLVDFLEDK